MMPVLIDETIGKRVEEIRRVTASPHGIGAQAPEGVEAMSKKHMGSSIDDFLKEEGVFEEAQAQAIKEVVAWQLAETHPFQPAAGRGHSWTQSDD